MKKYLLSALAVLTLVLAFLFIPKVMSGEICLAGWPPGNFCTRPLPDGCAWDYANASGTTDEFLQVSKDTTNTKPDDCVRLNWDVQVDTDGFTYCSPYNGHAVGYEKMAYGSSYNRQKIVCWDDDRLYIFGYYKSANSTNVKATINCVEYPGLPGSDPCEDFPETDYDYWFNWGDSEPWNDGGTCASDCPYCP